jgi:hypothetical protein
LHPSSFLLSIPTLFKWPSCADHVIANSFILSQTDGMRKDNHTHWYDRDTHHLTDEREKKIQNKRPATRKLSKLTEGANQHF